MKESSVSVFWTNLLWLNLKRFRKMWFWRFLLVVVNSGILFVLGRLSSPIIWWVLLGVFVFFQLIVVNLKTHLEARSTVVLLRSLGASRFFLIVNMFFEFLLPYVVGFFVATFVLMVMRNTTLTAMGKNIQGFFFASGVGFLLLVIVIPIAVLVQVYHQERYLKEL
ncbi:hypothetical protein [Thermospira aquatica]|uniref:FtsX-like permease family protein n=1 Tax=Thermospira aquatica TaxID=2828656 RepID=A0AAX3BD31_9SPIR|nr:hypothetical protein [Thermospira aquatica]URA10144.1 hypothetical protein KDW03_11790 [Thermospira aquatica]